MALEDNQETGLFIFIVLAIIATAPGYSALTQLSDWLIVSAALVLALPLSVLASSASFASTCIILLPICFFIAYKYYGFFKSSFGGGGFYYWVIASFFLMLLLAK